MVDHALGQRGDADPHAGPALATDTRVHRREGYIRCRLYPIDQTNTDDDHVKRNGDDRRDLTINQRKKRVSGPMVSSSSETARLTMGKRTY